MRTLLPAILLALTLLCSAGFARPVVHDWDDDEAPFGKSTYHGVRIVGLRSLGFVASIGNSTLTGRDSGREVEPIRSWGLGGFATLQMTDLMAFQPELHYMQRGGFQFIRYHTVYDDRVVYVTSESTWTLHYLEVPLMLKVGEPPLPPGAMPKKGERNKMRLHFEFGPSIGIKLGQEVDDNYLLSMSLPDEELYAPNHPHPGDLTFSLALGADGEMTLGGGNLVTRVRLLVGLWEMVGSQDELHTLAFTFGMGYGFPIY